MAFCFKDSQMGKFYDDINFVFASVTSEHVPKSLTPCGKHVCKKHVCNF
jgi:hypothetical protein